MERGDAIARELQDVMRELDAWETADLARLNSALQAKSLAPIQPLSRTEPDVR